MFMTFIVLRLYLKYKYFRDLDQACMEAVAALLRALPLQPEESDRGDLMDAKSQLFLK
jgi:neurofibromin 1